MAEIAIVIPVYITGRQEIEWLTNLLRTVFEQAVTTFEVVIIDDGSVERFAVSGVRVIRHNRRYGPGAARNTGIRATSAPWILPIDADDEFPQGAIRALYSNRDRADIVYGNVEYFGDRNGVEVLPAWDPKTLPFGTVPITALFARDLWRTVGGYDETLPGLEDADFWLKAAAAGANGYNVNEITLRYRKRPASRTAELIRRNTLEGIRQQLIRKYEGIWHRA